METIQENTWRIELPQFEGPFDLLLFFIERDELDIHDIPIAKITHDFLTYMHTMREMNIELAAEFILVASTLMRIKAKMLLPRPVFNEAGEEVDPREELVRRLLEYKRYKEVLAELEKMEEEQAKRAERGFSKQEEKLFMQSQYPEEELVGLDMYALMRTFQRIWARHHEQLQKPRHVIRKYPYTVEEVKNNLLEKVQLSQRVDFVSFVMEEKVLIYVVFTFLAILELVQLQKISITVGEGFNNFWVSKKEPTEAESFPSEDNTESE